MNNLNDTFDKHLRLLRESLTTKNLFEGGVNFKKIRVMFDSDEDNSVSINDLEVVIGKSFENLTDNEREAIDNIARENGWSLDGGEYKKDVVSGGDIGRKWNGSLKGLFPKGLKKDQVEYWTFSYENKDSLVSRNVYISDKLPDTSQVENDDVKNSVVVYEAQLIDFGSHDDLTTNYKNQMKNLKKIMSPNEFDLFLKNPNLYRSDHEISPFPPTKSKLGRNYFISPGWDKIKKTPIFAMFRNFGEAVRYAIYLDKNINSSFGGVVVKVKRIK